MGPIVILDKSAFQSLSLREHLELDEHFMENLTPILCLEILADLRKEVPGSKSSEQKVAELADKFGGSGPVTNVDYQTLCRESLLGNHFELDGHIVPESARLFPEHNGRHGLIVDLSPFNRSILRWADGEFEEFEREFAGYWRQVTQNLELESLQEQLNAHYVILPKVSDFKELHDTVDRLLATVAHQDIWFLWLLQQLSFPPPLERHIRLSWKTRRSVLLKNHSPYSCHCLRVLLMLLAGTKHRLLDWKPTNLLDVQYLYYLPFCMVFISNDRLHRGLAPLLLRDDQNFVVGSELKEDLQRLISFRDSLSDTDLKKLRYALGSYPAPAKSSVIWHLWKKYCRPWRPGRGSLITELSEQECEEAIRWVKQMFREVEGDGYFNNA